MNLKCFKKLAYSFLVNNLYYLYDISNFHVFLPTFIAFYKLVG